MRKGRPRCGSVAASRGLNGTGCTPTGSGRRRDGAERRSLRCVLGGVFVREAGPADDLQMPAHILDERGAAFNPIAIVAIEHAADVLDLGVVDMAADDAVELAGAG